MSMFSYEMGTNPGAEFEVGFVSKGIPTSAQKREALQELLDIHGTDPSIWQSFPEICLSPMKTGSGDWGRKPVEVGDDYWSAYGVLKEEPKTGYVPEGVRLPLRD